AELNATKPAPGGNGPAPADRRCRQRQKKYPNETTAMSGMPCCRYWSALFLMSIGFPEASALAVELYLIGKPQPRSRPVKNPLSWIHRPPMTGPTKSLETSVEPEPTPLAAVALMP